MRGLTTAVTVTVLALAATGCGNDREPAPDVRTPGPRLGDNPVDYPKAGVRFTAPLGWDVAPGQGQLVSTISTGEATIAVYRYPRLEPLPRTRAELDKAAELLVSAAKTRDPTFAELKRGRVRVNGKRGVQVRGNETIAGRPRTVRSTHLYAAGAEFVVDAFAPPADFRRVDAQSFRPLLRSLRIGKARGAG